MPEENEQLLTALTTEQFVLQSMRGAISSEAAARSALYVGTVSSALVALGFAANQSDDAFGVFVAAVLPALLVLGEFTFVRLVEISVEDMRYLAQIQRIRQYYATLSAGAPEFFPARDTSGYHELFDIMGIPRRRRMQTFFTAASSVAALVAIIVGVGVALLVSWMSGPLWLACVIGVVVALGAMQAHLVWQRSAYSRGLRADDQSRAGR